MPTYLALHELTPDGARATAEGPERLERAKELGASMNCEIRDFFVTNGRYDVAVSVEAPDDLTAKRLAMAVTSDGTVTTEFQRAFTEAEYLELVDGIPE